ncbi:MAG: thiolase family protein [Thermodesulfobacteriota bacterium]
MTESVCLVSAVRTPIGDFGGTLRALKPLDLMQQVIGEAIKRAALAPEQINQVIVGNCFAPLEQNIARISALLLGLPYETPGHTINCACSSGMQAVITGAMNVSLGLADVVVAGGVESMSNAPYILDFARWGQRLRHGDAIDLIWKSMQEYPVGGGMGVAAERLAEKYSISRTDLDELAVSSHQRGARAIQEGRFTREILPISVPAGRGKTVIVDKDEHPRADTTLDALAKLKPAFKEDGVVTAGNASSLNDGAAAVVIASERRAKELGLPVLARIKAHSAVAVDPHLVGIAPVPAIRQMLSRTGMTLGEVQLFEINEAFASYYLATEKELNLDRDITNVNGSGISLGHPVGCTGCRILVTLYHEMERQGLQTGIAALCAGGGVGTGILLER